MFPSFAEFFHAVHGFEPHAWQLAAADYTWDKGRLPGLLDVPTGLGKTSLVDVAVWALAKQLHAGHGRTIPQRVVHMVERRVIVDQTGGHIAQLVEAVNEGGSWETREVREALLSLNPANGQALTTATLHGGLRPESSWLQASGATLVASTVTQSVYRLFGRAIGGSQATAVIHAGLLAVDAAWIVDEPHLSGVAIHTLRQIADVQSTRLEGAVPATLTLTGATIPEHVRLLAGEGDVRVDPETETPHAQRRINAARPARVIVAKTASNKDMASTLASAAMDLVEEERSVLVVVSTVALAMAVAKTLGPHLHRVITSRLRAVDKSAEQMLVPGKITVATQTIEAGADIDADHLVTDTPDWPALVQRMGRLNRAGQRDHASATIVVARNVANATKDAAGKIKAGVMFVYGHERVAALSAGLLEASEGGTVELDFSIPALPATLAAVLRDTPVWPEKKRVARLTDYVARRALAGVPADMDVWMYGPDEPQTQGQVTVAWRSDLSDEALCEAPVRSDETIEVSVQVARSFVAGTGLPGDTSDTEVAHHVDPVAPPNLDDRLPLFRVLRKGVWVSPRSVRSISPGDVVVAHTEVGGYTPSLGLHGLSRRKDFDEAVSDVSLQRLVVTGYGAAAVTVESLSEVLSAEHAARVFADLTSSLTTREKREVLNEALPLELTIRRGTGTSIIVVPAGRTVQGAADNLTVTLDDHSAQVRSIAVTAAECAGVGGDVVEAIAAAALYHDMGKALPAFQRMLNRRQDKGVLAKGLRGLSLTSEEAGCAGYRHELGSALLMREGMFGEHSDLAVHLVAAHHGKFRPEFSPVAPAYLGLVEEHGPWGLAWAEAAVRTADWAASARPETPGAGAVRPHVDYEAAAARLVQLQSGTENTCPTIALEGLGGTSQLAWLTAVGVLAAATSLDPSAALSWDGNLVPQVRTSASREDVVGVLEEACSSEDRGLAAIKAPLRGSQGGKGLATKNHVIPLKDPVESVADEIRDLVKDVNVLARGVAEMMFVEWSSFKNGNYALAWPLPPFNASKLNQATGETFQSEALFNSAAGYRSKGAGANGALDFEELSAGTPRGGIMPSALIGAASMGASLDREAMTAYRLVHAAYVWSGPQGRRTLMPLPETPMTLEELSCLTHRHETSGRRLESRMVDTSSRSIAVLPAEFIPG